MNRDWISQRLPETWAIAGVIDQFQPDALLDLHELTPRDRDQAHVIGIPPGTASEYLRSIKKSFNDRGVAVRTKSRERHTSRALLHRYFAYSYKRPGFLVESKYTGDPMENIESRIDFHITTVIAVISEQQNLLPLIETR